MTDRDAWRGIVQPCSVDEVTLVIEMVLGPSERGGSGSFPARGSDGERWYVKPQNNHQGGRVITTEYIVSAAGRLIGAPVCEVQPVVIPPELAGHRFPSGLTLEQGVASASRAIGDAVEDRGLLHRDRDDNRRRHAGVFALYDWCWGGDPQWLYVEPQDGKLFSHDHGWYLPPEGPEWTEDALTAHVDIDRPLGHDTAGLDADELLRLADALDALGRDELVAALSGVPESWPGAEDLESVGFFLERRAPHAACRMRDLHAKLSQQP